ncbi:hypothetical protein BKA61DRAFT_619227 [Leptodontidium sp. MPI-SDFR-AT-0119]|nr:hypothetical protein BKA61DRAFT_619227 [Leptodontidium sp. MPI-SDFR-AT-0119]
MEFTALEEFSRLERSTGSQQSPAAEMAAFTDQMAMLFDLLNNSMKLQKMLVDKDLEIMNNNLEIAKNNLEIQRQHNLRFSNPLLDHLAAASTMTKQEIAPLMKYFQGILDTRKRFRHPASANRQVNDSGPASFTVFPNLPTELRRLIWKHSTSDARIFEIRPGSVNYLERAIDAKVAHRSILNIARSCKEAYLSILERFEKVKLIGVCSFYAVPVTSSGFGEQTYLVNWEQDIFYLPDGNMEDFFSTQYQDPLGNENEDLVKVKNVALHFEWIFTSTETDQFISVNMPKIKQIIYVADCERRLDTPRIELEQRRGVEYPLMMGFPGYEELDHAPLIRTYVGDDEDHPYRKILDDEFMDLSVMFATPEVKQAYKGIRVWFELWRRPAKE